MDKLRECPFCGSDAELKKISDRWTAKCTNECAGTRIFNDKNRAVLAWNARAEEPNEPLTLDELKQMDGEPVWFTNMSGERGAWGLIKIDCDGKYMVRAAYNTTRGENNYGKTWLAYKHKPKEADYEK